MNNRLNAIWSKLGCEVRDKTGKNRRVISSSGATLVDGGYQSELLYLQIKHPATLSDIPDRRTCAAR